MLTLTTATAAGFFRHKASIEQRSQAQDDFGQRVDVWTPVSPPVWAALEQLSGRQLIAAQAISTEVTHKLVVRWQAVFNNPVKAASMRAVFRGRVFEIHHAFNADDRDRETHFMVAEGLTNG